LIGLHAAAGPSRHHGDLDRHTLLGLTRDAGHTGRGPAAITVHLDQQDGQADFTCLESWAACTHPGTPGTGTQWGDGDLGCTLTLSQDGTQSGFDSAFAAGDDPGVVTGVFVSTAHEGRRAYWSIPISRRHSGRCGGDTNGNMTN